MIGRLRRTRPPLSVIIPLALGAVASCGLRSAHGADGPKSGSSAAAPNTVILAPKGTWSASLPGNVRVRLVGITAGPSFAGPWWGPDGKLLPTSPYPEETAAERILRPSDYSLFGGKPGEKPWYFAFEITQPPSADVQVIGANTLEPTMDEKAVHVRVRCLAFLPAGKRIGTASLSLASAGWQIIARAHATGGHFTGKDRQGAPYDFHLQVHVLPVTVNASPQGSVIRVEWSGHFSGSNPWQINVLDRKGQPMEQVVGGTTAPTANYHIEFRPHNVDVPTLASISEILVQVRPQEDVLFEAVPLHPIPTKATK